ncbi:hypothetical protein LCGC14_2377630 [marine sediment metagenome]|uniref:GIY-YIG domain-containing protein n=1 Tax=marine sediment metagenome TaxID=412755 RepID=A0A0F9EEC1_9ZZZZ
MVTTIIYTLSDPRSGDVRYVGQTGDLHLRMIAHMSEARTVLRTQRIGHRTPEDLYEWIAELIQERTEPVVVEIDRLDCDGTYETCGCLSYCQGASDIEEACIADLEERGSNLFNIARPRKRD